MLAVWIIPEKLSYPGDWTERGTKREREREKSAMIEWSTGVLLIERDKCAQGQVEGHVEKKRERSCFEHWG